MTQETFRALTATTHFPPALLWGLIAQDVWRFLRRRRPGGAFARLLLALALCTMAHHATWTIVEAHGGTIPA